MRIHKVTARNGKTIASLTDEEFEAYLRENDIQIGQCSSDSWDENTREMFQKMIEEAKQMVSGLVEIEQAVSEMDKEQEEGLPF